MKCPFWLEVHRMNEFNCYWLINLASDDPFDYLLNGTSNQVKQKMISLVKWPMGFSHMQHFGQVGQVKKPSLAKMANGAFSQIKLLSRWTKKTSYLPTYLPTLPYPPTMVPRYLPTTYLPIMVLNYYLFTYLLIMVPRYLPRYNNN